MDDPDLSPSGLTPALLRFSPADPVIPATETERDSLPSPIYFQYRPTSVPDLTA